MIGRSESNPQAVWLLLPACLLLLASGRAAYAEAPPDAARQPWTLDEALGLPERLSLEVDHRTRYEYLDNQFRAGRPGDDQVFALRTRVRAKFRFTDWLGVGAEFQDSRAYLADANTPVNTSLVNAAELLRAYVELHFKGPFGGAHEVQLGRITMDMGSRRLVARNRYRNTSNAFTGIDWTWSGEDGRELRAFYTLPVKRRPYERERLVDNEVEFDDTSADFQFAGLFYVDELPKRNRIELYAFGLYERAPFDPNDPVNVPFRKLGTPGFRLFRRPREGRIDYELETALQFGRSRATPTGNQDLDHIAHFHHGKLGYTFAKPWAPRVLVHYNYASGDRDPFDGHNERFDTLFGARRWEWGPTSIYGPWARANVNSPGIRLQLRPSPKLTGFVDYRAVWLASDRDEWVGTGVQDPTGDSGNFVGQQIEWRLRWRPFLGNVLLELGYAHIFAGEFIDDAPNSNGGDTNYVYSQVLLEF